MPFINKSLLSSYFLYCFLPNKLHFVILKLKARHRDGPLLSTQYSFFESIIFDLCLLSFISGGAIGLPSSSDS